jgi:hypothetical protein
MGPRTDAYKHKIKSNAIFFKIILGVVTGFVIGHQQAMSVYELSPLPSTTLAPNRPAPNKNEDGWNSIDVFYGSTDHSVSLLPPGKKWFSQVRQDEVVLKMLSNGKGSGIQGGFFVDLASNDATSISNSYILERDYHWTGLCIEPNPTYWYGLTHYRPNCQLVAAVVGAQRMDQVDFLFETGAFGGIIGTQFDNGPIKKGKSKVQYTVTLLEILERYNAPKVIDYLSLDVEGAEEFIMQHFPLQNYKIRILTVERPSDGLREILKSHGYEYLMKLSTWGETLWAHQDYIKDFDMEHLQEFEAVAQKKAKDEAKALKARQQQQG